MRHRGRARARSWRARIGVALSDELGILASPLCILQPTRGNGSRRWPRLAREHGVVEIVVGLPADAPWRDRTAGPASGAVRRGAARRRRRTGEVMGRTVLDGGGDRPPGRRAASRPLAAAAGRLLAARGRRGGGGDPPGVSGLATLLKLVIALLAIAADRRGRLSPTRVRSAVGERARRCVRGGLEQLDTPVSDDSRQVTFTVRPGQSAIEIGDDLYARGLIRSPLTFRTLVEARGVGDKIESGDYQLSPSMTTAEIVAVLSQGRQPQRHRRHDSRGLARRAGGPEDRGARHRAADEVLALVRAAPGSACRWPSRCRRAPPWRVPLPRDVRGGEGRHGQDADRDDGAPVRQGGDAEAAPAAARRAA